MRIQIFTEDELNKAYMIIAEKALEAYGSYHPGDHTIRVVRVHAIELTSFEELLDLTQRAQRSGADQVLFLMDHEGPAATQDRIQNREDFEMAFSALCAHLQNLPETSPLRAIKVVRVEVHSCLECWLLAHPQAVVMSAGGAGNFNPAARNTMNLTPREARNQIAHILREVGRRSGKRHLRMIGGQSVKRWGEKIARYISISEARRHNASLHYFCEMVDREQDGCQRPFPIGENHA